MGHYIKIDELVKLAKKIPKNEVLVQTLQNHPHIEFEVVEMYGEDIDIKVSQARAKNISAVRDRRTSAERMRTYRKCSR